MQRCGATEKNWNRNPKFLVVPTADTQMILCVSQVNVCVYGHDDEYPIKVHVSKSVLCQHDEVHII